jgi:hypothetical protein
MRLDDLDLPSVQTPEDEEARERKWASFEADCAIFAESEPDGYAAVLRAVARAMKQQQELVRG